MPSITSRLTILSGSAIVVVGASAAVAMAAVGSDAPRPVPAAQVVPAAARTAQVVPKARRASAAETVPMAAPPAGVTVPMPTVEPRVRVPGTSHDEHGVDLGGRPQMRLKMTSADTQPYWDRYNACLHEHGVPLYPNRGLSPVQEDRDPAAERACAGLMPRMPIALDRDRNPSFARDLANEIACINAHGDPVAADPEGGFWSYRDPANARERAMSTLEAEPKRLAIERACELEAFGGDDR